MDIQRRPIAQASPSGNPRNSEKKTSVSPVTPVFPEPSFAGRNQDSSPHMSQKITPTYEPQVLGEEQLWYSSVSPESQEESVEYRDSPKPVFPTKESVGAAPKNRFHFPHVSLRFPFSRLRSVGIVLLIFIGIGGVYGFFMKSVLEKNIELGMEHTQAGLDSLGTKDFGVAKHSFAKAEKSFATARRQTLYFPPWLAKPLTVIPGVSKLGSGVLVVDGSIHLVRALSETASVAETIVTAHVNPTNGKAVSYIDTLATLEEPLGEIRTELKKAESSLGSIPERDIPEEKRLEFSLLQSGLPGVVGGIDSLLANTPLIEELLGKNGPRIYLFLFQNNQELRPTGGFIGTYGILEFKNGAARRFFIDGIFNPDGQLKENIIPPTPIQKISAGWSLHDSNWFPDFPTSAEKAIFFYEKTGGPTVDGVFTMTPTVMERLLALTGPIELPEYEMVVDSKNFIPTIQEQVEIKYDKQENKPKKVLSDLSSILLERVFALTDPLALYQVANILVEGMNEKQILLYTRNQETEKLIENNGWSGKIDESPHDYLSVIHTNINGYKTDGVVEDTIDHKIKVEEDGSIVATTTVSRAHQGGNTPYDWWNRVNSNYMRVYVPKGSELINATGHTREVAEPPLDYELLGFKKDKEVTQEEEAIVIDKASGTRVGEEFGKTVFGNWVYVSPGETVSVEYTYLLPFRIDPTQENARSYSLLFQKQPGVKEVRVKAAVEYPKSWNIYWTTESDLQHPGESGIQLERTTREDMFWGVVFDD